MPNNYSLFRVNYSDNCRTTRQLLAFSGKLLVFSYNYLTLQLSIISISQLSESIRYLSEFTLNSSEIVVGLKEDCCMSALSVG